MPRRTTIARPVARPGRAVRRARPAVRVPIAAVVVAVPARDEERSVRACLRSIDRAATAVPGIDVVIVVAADCCRDDTARVAAATLSARARTVVVVEGSWRGPGAARRAAVSAGLASCATPAEAVWLASTDADCVVDDDWLVAQLAHAAGGSDAVAGVVRLDPTAPARLRAEFAAAYAVAGDTHRHVHAANLGLRAGAYLDVGGWSPHAVVGEEHNLWRRLRQAGHRVAHPVDVVVTTSARTHGRVIGGFASTLARLEAQAVAGAAERSA
jgi:glycosyltransferase involved in cell wall biosynthesis